MPTSGTDLRKATVRHGGRLFVRSTVPDGENQGLPFALAQPLAGRYEIVRFFASGGLGLVLEGRDLHTGAAVLVKAILRYDVVSYARVGDEPGFTNQLVLPRKTLEMERRILVQLRNAGCNAVPHPNDFVFDTNPQLAVPVTTEDGREWAYSNRAMIDAEPYLVMESLPGQSLAELLRAAPEHRLSEMRSLRIMRQVAGVLRTLHQSLPMRPGMTWQLIYQDLKPANVLVSALDRVSVLDLGSCQLLNRDTNQKLLPGACTAGYCPPECELPLAHLTPAADVYTVGSNLFELLTGRAPAEFLPARVGPTQPRSVRLDLALLEGRCRPATRRLAQRCLAPDPEDRYPDAQTLERALADILAAPAF